MCCILVKPYEIFQAGEKVRAVKTLDILDYCDNMLLMGREVQQEVYYEW